MLRSVAIRAQNESGFACPVARFMVPTVAKIIAVPKQQALMLKRIFLSETIRGDLPKS
ncbi:hypothetical protein EME01_57290 [Sinorhizobium meliloti]|nr:hypothetical protein EME01_57290 [Sinorhizobium meliloti]